MPLLRLQTSIEIPTAQRDALLAQLSAATAKQLGKPESYMMVALADQRPMLFGGDAAPAAFVEVRSVGTISPEQARGLSAALSEVLAARLGLAPERIYYNFAGVPGAMWGHGAHTFG